MSSWTQVALRVTRTVLRELAASRPGRALAAVVIRLVSMFRPGAADHLAYHMPHEGIVRARRAGVQWTLNLADNVSWRLYYTGSYEGDLTTLFADCLPRDCLFIDVGAHLGIHAIGVARRRRDVVAIAFEPGPDMAARLRSTGKSLSNLKVAECALGDRRGVAELRAGTASESTDAGMRSLFGAGPVVSVVNVDVFDLWVEENLPVPRPRLGGVKLDVEGCEFAALQGMRRSLIADRPRLVVVERQSPNLMRAGIGFHEIVNFMEAIGYREADTAIVNNSVFHPVGS